jgi:hypothetical protein
MSWAGRRKFSYISGIILFFLIVVGGPIAYKIATIPATCHDGKQDQGETSVDRGGPCLLLDDRYLQPHAILWARSFQVRDGSYNAVAYVENPNKDAGVVSADYKFSLYDSQNILIAERTGTTYIMPGGITPVFTAGIDTGNRIVAHTYFAFTDPTLVWERMSNPTAVLTLSDKQVSNTDTEPQVSASVENTSVADLENISFVGVVFDTTGNAINASATQLARLDAGSSAQIGFTWPIPFTVAVGSEDITPIMPPIPDPTALK